MVRKISWICFELIYEVKSAAHIGNGSQFGISNKTRFYIPGKTMWGAITAIITRWYMTNYDPHSYKEIGEFIRENLIFSYFYPYYMDKNEKMHILHPNYSDMGFGFGIRDNGFIMSKIEFESKFITSYISTAIDTNSKTAEDESLHEIELLNPSKFIGHIFINKEQVNNNSILKIHISNEEKVKISKDKETIELFELIKNVQVGGERTYGFGKLKLEKTSLSVDKLYNKYEINLNKKAPTLNVDIALSHLNFNNDYFNKLREIKGELEPLVWRDWDNEKGMGHKKEFNMIALVPGSKFKKQKVKICDFGIWHLD
ncbi:MAG: RAMP superfamily CRISPR-associated protein [Promethearchaeota archaeon]